MHCLSEEARRPSPNGTFWPIERERMLDRACIIERMAEDLAALRRERGEFQPVGTPDLEEIGWTRPHVTLFFWLAADLLRKQEEAAHRATLRAGIPAREVAIACGLFAVITGGIWLAGALSLIERVA
jgi:hypothetical protein